MKKRFYFINYYIFFIAALLQAGCTDQGREAHFVQAELEMWLHYGSEAERRTIQQQVSRYNGLQDNVVVNAVILPEGQYHEKVSAAAANGKLPDILEVDPDYVGFRAWRQQLQPIDKLLSDSVREDLLLPVIHQSIYQGRQYAVSPESRIALVFVRKSALTAAGLAVIEPASWTLARFYDVVARLHESAGARSFIELKHYADEQQLSDEILPLVYASEADSGTEAEFVDHLTGASTVRLFRFFHDGFRQGFFSRQKNDAFLTGKAVLALGSQADINTYQQAWKDDLLILPMPGVQRTKFMFHSGWSLGLTRDCRDEQAAIRFIEFLLQPEEVLIMSEASHTFPATYSAVEMTEGPLLVKSLSLGTRGTETDQNPTFSASPAYPQLRRRFYRLFMNVAHGKDVASELAQARNDMTTILRQYQLLRIN